MIRNLCVRRPDPPPHDGGLAQLACVTRDADAPNRLTRECHPLTDKLLNDDPKPEVITKYSRKAIGAARPGPHSPCIVQNRRIGLPIFRVWSRVQPAEGADVSRECVGLRAVRRSRLVASAPRPDRRAKASGDEICRRIARAPHRRSCAIAHGRIPSDASALGPGGSPEAEETDHEPGWALGDARIVGRHEPRLKVQGRILAEPYRLVARPLCVPNTRDGVAHGVESAQGNDGGLTIGARVPPRSLQTATRAGSDSALRCRRVATHYYWSADCPNPQRVNCRGMPVMVASSRDGARRSRRRNFKRNGQSASNSVNMKTSLLIKSALIGAILPLLASCVEREVVYRPAQALARQWWKSAGPAAPASRHRHGGARTARRLVLGSRLLGMERTLGVGWRPLGASSTCRRRVVGCALGNARRPPRMGAWPLALNRNRKKHSTFNAGFPSSRGGARRSEHSQHAAGY